MKEFIAQYEHTNDNKINPALFNREFDRPLVEYVLDVCRSLEVLPAITFEGYEYITDQTKIRRYVDKNLSKDPKIRNNVMLERLVQPNRSINDLLIMKFRVKVKGREQVVTRRMFILKRFPGNRYIKGGKVVVPLIQVVDNSTFVKGNVLKFKTMLYPIDLYLVKQKLTFSNGKEYSCPAFRMNLFKKIANPLLYYLAHFGVDNTIEFFGLESIMSVVDSVIDPENYVYIKPAKGIYIEVRKKALLSHEFIPKFVGSLYDILAEDKTITYDDVGEQDYWLERLSELISKKRTVSKGERTLISFAKLMDPTTKKRLVLKKSHKRDTYTIVRWMMTNYPELIKKDSHDLKNKRIRSNECQAYYFSNYITRNVYSVLNTDNPSFEKYLSLLNAIGEDTLLRVSQGGSGGGSTSMFRYERYNDFDAIDLLRYTLKGPTGINGGKNGVHIQYRDIYPSHLGRYDLNVCSSSDPGLTGYLCANLHVDSHGYFDANNAEPDTYDRVIGTILKKLAIPGYRKSRDDIAVRNKHRDENGFIKIHKRMTEAELNKEFWENPWKHGLYYANGKMSLIPKHERDAKGFIKLTKKRKPRTKNKSELIRDENGFVVLKRVKLKINTDRYK